MPPSLALLRRTPASIIALGLMLACALLAAAQSPGPVVRAQLGAPQSTDVPQVQPASVPLQAPPPSPLAPPPAVFPTFAEVPLMPIDLGTALRLAGTSNFDIGQAREFVNVTRTELQKAYAQFLPTLNMGSTYTHHEGKIQKTEGNIENVNRDSLFVGGGPSMTLSFADAIYAPLVARQVATASQAGFRRVQNDTLLTVSEAYFAMLRARRKLARVELTLEYLTSEKTSPIRAGSKGLLPVVQAMQKAGVAAALKAEVHRVEVEVLRRQEERIAALQEFRVAVAELARLLRLDPTTALWPVEDFRLPVELPGPYYAQPLEELVRIGLNNRPELAESQALVQAAVERIRTAKARPLLPSLVVNYSWGDFGGGPDANPAKIGGFGPSGRILHIGTRTDFDVSLVWKLQNLGVGNYLEVRQQQALARQATLRQLQLRDIVVTQLVQAQALVKGWEERAATARSALFNDVGKPTGPVFEAIRLNFIRVREVQQTRPLEVLDSIRSLSDLLDTYSGAITDYDRARLRLLVALGLTPLEIISRASAVPAPAPEKK